MAPASDKQVVPYVGTWIEIMKLFSTCWPDLVVPYVGTWIEMIRCAMSWAARSVVPYVGTWIEILKMHVSPLIGTSRSLRGNVDRNDKRVVAHKQNFDVVPYVGTWIEIHAAECNGTTQARSFPTWERG